MGHPVTAEADLNPYPSRSRNPQGRSRWARQLSRGAEMTNPACWSSPSAASVIGSVPGWPSGIPGPRVDAVAVPIRRLADDRCVVVAAEYDHPELFEAVDRAAFAWRRPWFPVLLDHPYLRCGPVVVPTEPPVIGASGAVVASTRRPRACGTTTSHRPCPAAPTGSAGTPATTSGWPLAWRSGRSPTRGRPDGPPGGWVRTVALADGAPQRAGVVAVDGCDRCRPASAPDGTGSPSRSRSTRFGHGVPSTTYTLERRGGSHGR